jgi:hypothetical protein
MKKLKKAKEGTELSNVTKKETNMEALKGFYKKDYLKADSAKTGVGKVLRKAGNTAIKAAFTPQALMATALRTGATAKANKEELAKKKMGGMIKRADGSYSKRGLWDNIRANKGSGKKPTAQMLKQEKKIKSQTKNK